MIKKFICCLLGHKFGNKLRNKFGVYTVCMRCNIESYSFRIDQGSFVNTFEGIKISSKPIWINHKAKENGDE